MGDDKPWLDIYHQFFLVPPLSLVYPSDARTPANNKQSIWLSREAPSICQAGMSLESVELKCIRDEGEHLISGMKIGPGFDLSVC